MIKLIQLISELHVNNPNITAEKLWKWYSENISFKNYINEIEPIFKKVPEWQPNVAQNLSISTWFKNISQKSLNLIYKDLKQFAKIQNINELSVNRPSRTYDIREENWHNLSVDIFDKIEIGDRIIDPEFIGIVYKKEEDWLDGFSICYKDDKGGDKFLSKSWFDAVSQED